MSPLNVVGWPAPLALPGSSSGSSIGSDGTSRSSIDCHCLDLHTEALPRLTAEGGRADWAFRLRWAGRRTAPRVGFIVPARACGRRCTARTGSRRRRPPCQAAPLKEAGAAVAPHVMLGLSSTGPFGVSVLGCFLFLCV